MKPDKELLNRYLNNACSVAEVKFILDWLNTAEGKNFLNEQLNDDIQRIQRGEEFLLDHEIRSDVMFGKLQQTIHKPDKYKSFLYTKWFRAVAAALVPLFMLSIALWLVVLKPQKALVWNEIYVPKGERRQLVLYDGTTVWINSDTRIYYPLEFRGKTREVKLSGEAYFSVIKNRKKPFMVHLKELDVKVTGTSFNIRALDNDKNITATLDEGIISLSLPKADNKTEEYTLKPGQQASFSKNTGTVSLKNVHKGIDSDWKNNEIRFIDAPLSEVIREIERLYNVDFKIVNKNLPNYRYTISFKNGTIQEVLFGLESITPITCKLVNNAVEIYTR